MIVLPLLLVFFVLAAAFFASSQVALFSLNPIDLRLASHQTAIHRLLATPRDLLVTLLFCDVSANILLQNTVAKIFGEKSSWMLTVGLSIALTLFLGEIIPKSLALSFRLTVASFVAPLLVPIQKCLRPLCRPLVHITSSISHVIFPFLRPDPSLSQKEISYLVQLSADNGVLEPHEARWMTHYLKLSHHTLKERMHPRDELTLYNIDDPLSKLSACFEHTCEVAVYRGNPQNVLGSLRAAEYFIHRHITALTELLHRPFYAPESRLLSALFTQILNQDLHLCLVVDEYGVITGWLSRQDLFRMLLAHPQVHTHGLHEPWIVQAKFELAEFERLFHTPLKSAHNMITLGGWLMEQLGEIPKTGTTFLHDGFLFQVVDAEPHRIRTLSIKRIAHGI